jgi:hypothetical protein
MMRPRQLKFIDGIEKNSAIPIGKSWRKMRHSSIFVIFFAFPEHDTRNKKLLDLVAVSKRTYSRLYTPVGLDARRQ